MLGSSPPNVSLSDLMKQVIGRSSRKLQQEFAHLRKRYWGRHPSVRGDLYLTSGSVMEERIHGYMGGPDREPHDPDITVEE